MIKFHRILLLILAAVFLASTAGIARYAADSCTQSRMYRQLAAQTEKFPDDAVSTGNNFLPQYQALYTQNSDLAGWIQIDGTNINYPVMQSKQDSDFYLKHNCEKADSPHGCPYVQANCDLQTPSDNILVYGHNMKDGTMFSDLLWCCTIKVDIENSKSQYIEKDKQEATKDGSKSTKIQHGI